MENIERKKWIENMHTAYNVNKLGRLTHPQKLLNEAETCYVKGLYFASILCTHAAITSYLLQRSGTGPKLTKNKQVRIDGLFKLLNKLNFLTVELKEEIKKFSRIRGNIEHPKSQMEDILADWEHDIEEDSPNLRVKTINETDKSIWFNPEINSKKGLLLYYKMCLQIFNQMSP